MELFRFLNNSLLSRSGQLWKLVVAALAVLFGSFAPLYSALGISWAIGTVIAMGGYAFGLIFIRCTNCANRWLWEATKGNADYSVLFKRSPCPNCHSEFL
jgi:hypothetical protein